MMCSEAITRIQRKLGYRTDKEDEILEELQDAQRRLENGVPAPGSTGTYIPYFLATEVASALTTIDEERLLLPTDFLSELENYKLYVYDADAATEEEKWRPLAKDDEAFLKSKYPGGGEPKSYYVSGSYFRFRPVPDAEYTIKLVYGGRDTTLTSTPDITNKWLTDAPWLLIGAAGMSLSQSLRDATAMGFFQQHFGVENQAIYQKTLAREITNDRPVMGGEN